MSTFRCRDTFSRHDNASINNYLRDWLWVDFKQKKNEAQRIVQEWWSLMWCDEENPQAVEFDQKDSFTKRAVFALTKQTVSN